MQPSSRLPFALRLAAILILTGLVGACASGQSVGPSGLAPSPLGLDSQLRLAEAALAGGDIDSALRLYRAAVAQFPQAKVAQQGLADAYYAIRAYPEARAAYARLGSLDPADAAAALGQGRVALATSDTDAAERAFADALAVDPDRAEALNGRAVALDLGGRHRDAQDIYRSLLRRDPANRAVANNLALSQALAGETGLAIDRLADLANGPTIMPEARHNLALAYALAGDTVAARSLIRRDLSGDAVADTLAFYQTLDLANGRQRR